MDKLSKTIEQMDKEELLVIKKDLKTGKIERLVSKRLEEQQQEKNNKICPVCQSDIGDDSYTLIFGPSDLRKKASFCATDCLEYFIQKIKKVNK